MRRIALFSVMLLSLTIAAPAQAITGGQVDGTRHPNVGVVGCTVAGPEFALITTAQLISSTVVLTAGHATEFFNAPDSGCLSFFASFDPVFSFTPGVSTLLPATRVVTDPTFDPTTQFDDVGVFILKKPVKGITPVQLPTAGLLDQLKLAGTLQTEQFVTVGYGATADCTAGPCSYSFDGVRRFATEAYNGLTRNFISFHQNATATGEGGYCFGDSGGPHFLGASNLSVGVTSWTTPGARSCGAQGSVQRLDIPTVRDFLGRFVTLP